MRRGNTKAPTFGLAPILMSALAFVFVLALPLGSARADQDDDYLTCQRAGLADIQSDRQTVLATCDRALETPDLDEDKRIQVLAKRASIYAYARDFEAAIVDFSAILDFKPGDAFAYAGRGNVYLIEGRMARAIADLDEAIKIDPNFGGAYNLRGLANFYLGDMGRASADFRRAYKMDLENPYLLLWFYMAENRTGRGFRADAQLQKNIANLPHDEWPAPVFALFLGEISVDEFIAMAPQGDDQADRERRCEIYFYAGEDQLMSGAPELAAELFREVLKTGVDNFKEYRAAKAELARLEK